MKEQLLVRVPSGVIIDVNKIVAILRQELNKYVIIIEGRPEAAIVDGADVDCLVEAGYVKSLQAKPQIAA